jgi:RNA polymerase sigma factor for flagellar operon FliA
VLAFVGPTGAGKTSAIAKLAFRLGVAQAKAVQVFSIDNLRIGASDQLAHICSLLGVPFQSLDFSGALPQALAGTANRGIVLIDTPGYAAGDTDIMEETAGYLSQVGMSHCHLVLPATLRYSDMQRRQKHFSCFAPSRLLFTRLDETEYFGPAWAFARATRLAVDWVSRETLILEHLPQVRLIARRIHERLPGSVSLDDLISTGIVGLISAIDNFDPKLNVKLKTYAEYKIRGAILDSLRGMDWAPRQQRKRVKMIEAAIATLEQRNHRAPSEDEIARELGLSTEEYHDWLIDVRGVNLGSLEGHAPEEEGRDLLRFVSDSEEHWPSRIVERAELERLLAQAIEKMPYVERTVLGLYYHEELTLREIAKVVKLHESRVSQLKSQAILRLRAYLEKRWPMDRGL